MIQRMKKTEKQKNRERKTAEKRRAKLIWHRILELLYPTTCVFCGTVASEGICESCRKEVKILQEPLCKKCGKPVRYEEQEYCYDCQKIIHFYEQGRSLWLHKIPVSQSIYQFKYRNRRVFAQYYAEQMAEQFADLLRKWQIEVIIPVPIHKSKRRKRGYNQAEVLAKELSGRLEEMPAEEGFPAYLASRLSAFYERAGYVENLNGTEGSVTIIGAVSPQGGDFSEPVTQNTKRFVRCFLALDKSLAYARHYPAINWLTSYSEYVGDLSGWYSSHVGSDFVYCRNEILNILTTENRLNEIVKLIGSDVLPDDQKLVLEIARVIRLGFLQQNAFHSEDTFVPMEKQLRMMEVILHLYDRCKALIDRNMPMALLRESEVFEKIIAIKYDVPNQELGRFEQYNEMIEEFYQHLMATNA